jgi:three-Cys-motif partner protein
MNTADANPRYWREYSNLQQVKHHLIRNYLNGWFPKMALGPGGAGRLLYIDTHAGRGKHLSGALGSPLVALDALLNHTWRDKLLQRTEVRFSFIERNVKNFAVLNQELATLTRPSRVFAEAEHGDAFQIIENEITKFERHGRQLAPAFIFVDPYGFKIPAHLLRKLLSYPKVELFVNVIWRELDMAIRNVRKDTKPRAEERPNYLFEEETDSETNAKRARRRPDGAERARRRAERKARLEQTLNWVFGGDRWRKIDARSPDNRADQCAKLFQEITGARWGTYIRMMNHGRIRYLLLHLTNHDEGRDWMKECMWQVCPQGGFYASKADDPRQAVLVKPEPDLTPLCGWVRERLSAGPKHWETLMQELREEMWLEKHLNDVIYDMRRDRDIAAENFSDRFARRNNPLLRLVPKQPKQLTLFE